MPENHNVLLFMFVLIYIDSASSVRESDLFPHEESEGSTRYYFGDDGQIKVRFTSPVKLFNQTYWSTDISGNGAMGFSKSKIQIINRLNNHWVWKTACYFNQEIFEI